MKKIDEWKKEATEAYIARVQKVAEAEKRWQADYGHKRYGYTDYRKEVPIAVLNLSRQHNEKIKADVEKIIAKKFEVLQEKVIAKIGQIIEIEPLGGDDYNFIGEKGNCTVQVIGAGGYNIQAWHTRWIIR